MNDERQKATVTISEVIVKLREELAALINSRRSQNLSMTQADFLKAATAKAKAIDEYVDIYSALTGEFSITGEPEAPNEGKPTSRRTRTKKAQV